MILNVQNGILICFFLTLLVFSCKSTPEIPQNNNNQNDTTNPVNIGAVQPNPVEIHQTLGLADEIRSLTETGVLSSMLRAIELIRSRDLGGTEFGRLMSGINTLFIRLIYHDFPVRLPIIDFPLTSNYSRIIREADGGFYVSPPPDSTDFFEYVLPFLSVREQIRPDFIPVILGHLGKAAELRPNSILPPYFSGILYERAGMLNEAHAAFTQAFRISNECYPAQIRIARLNRLAGDIIGAVFILSDLVISYPDSSEIKKELAYAYYATDDFSRALPLIDEILQAEPRNGEFLLMRAAIMIEQGRYFQANVSLDNYASINPNNRSYLYMRARVQIEGNRNRDSALNYLRSILRSNPYDEEIMIYTATLLLGSQRPADLAEGRDLLERLRRISGSSIEVMDLSLRDAIRQENWLEAREYIGNILAVRRSVQDITDAFHIERNLGDNIAALLYANELFQIDTNNNEYTILYITSLIDNGWRDEALALLDSRLNLVTSGSLKSRFYFQRSRLRSNTNDALSDLRLSRFEDSDNLDPIIAMFEIYYNRRDSRMESYFNLIRARAPDHPVVRRYEREFPSASR